MDGWGALTMLIKRQQADKRRKAEIRANYIKKKRSHIDDKILGYEFDFPELTTIELDKIKNQIRKKIIRKRIKSFILSSIIFLIALAGILYLFIKKGFI